ncbi:hypothetical protein KIL84_013169 [Mauremys mutica]|uniref:Uncharacterized protein n=1 Tax=Mauremys mutica TaxID=74926 RepID=A0A9D3WQN7_9SAUR|nr:hypothetical protein KIL84_013169 [Mauremys mutica]
MNDRHSFQIKDEHKHMRLMPLCRNEERNSLIDWGGGELKRIIRNEETMSCPVIICYKIFNWKNNPSSMAHLLYTLGLEIPQAGTRNIAWTFRNECIGSPVQFHFKYNLKMLCLAFATSKVFIKLVTALEYISSVSSLLLLLW